MHVGPVAEYLLRAVLLVGLAHSFAGMTHAQSGPPTGASLPKTWNGELNMGKEVPPTSEGDGSVYRIGVEDELQISVWREPELSIVAVVRPDGKITMPLLNDVAVVGLKPEELQTFLAVKLKPFLNEPQVTVIARIIRSRKVFLVGQVSHQGSYPLNGTLTILELIANAGGLTPFAKKGSIYVLRTEKGQKKRISFDYKKALAGTAQNITLMPGDAIVIP